MKFSHSDLGFSHDDDHPTPMPVATLLAEYADGRRHFHNLDLRDGNLAKAKLTMISLEESILQRANLIGANLAGATLNHVDLTAANLTNANLIAADLVRARLISANLTGAVLSGANLSGASLRKADLTNCIFAGTNLSGVDFSGATLSNVVFGGANLRGANLSDVDLEDVDLTNVDLTETILPEGLAGQRWLSENRDFSASFGEPVPGWEHPTGDYVSDQDEADEYAQKAISAAMDNVVADQEQYAQGYSPFADPANDIAVTDFQSEFDPEIQPEFQPGFQTEDDSSPADFEPDDDAITAYQTDGVYSPAIYDTDGSLDYQADSNLLAAPDAEIPPSDSGAIDPFAPSRVDALPEHLGAPLAMDDIVDDIVDDDTLYLNALDAIDAIAMEGSDADLGPSLVTDGEIEPSFPDLPFAPWSDTVPTSEVIPSNLDASGLDSAAIPPNPFVVPSSASPSDDALGDSEAEFHGVTSASDFTETSDGTEEETQFLGFLGPEPGSDRGGATDDPITMPLSVPAVESWDPLPTEDMATPQIGALGAEMPLSEEFQTQEAIAEDITAEDPGTEDSITDSLVAESPATESFATDSLVTESFATENLTPENLVTDSLVTEDLGHEKLGSEAVTGGENWVANASMEPPHPEVVRPEDLSSPQSAPDPDEGLAFSSNRATPAMNARVVQSIQAALGRRVQYSLQRKLLDLYHGRCAVTGCDVQQLLDTVFITSHNRDRADHPSQCLVLRSDLKTLYELKLLAIHPEQGTVLLSPALFDSDYSYLQGRPIAVPEQKIYHPSPEGLAQNLQDCTWYDAAYIEQSPAGLAQPSSPAAQDLPPAAQGSAQPAAAQSWPIVPMIITLGLGSVALMALGWGMLRRPPALETLAGDPDTSTAQVETETANRINLQAGSVRFNQQGVLIDQKAYLSLAQAQQWGLVDDGDIPREYQRQYQGQPYVSLAYLTNTGTPVTWDAQSRTAILDCCQSMAVETVTLTVNNRELPTAGLIVDNRAYVPQSPMNDLNLDVDRLNPSHSLEYQNETYVRASDLKDLSVTVDWDSESRVLSIRN